MDPMQLPGAHPPQDGVVTHADSTELRDRDDAVLARCDPRRLEIWLGDFLGHMPNKSPDTQDSPPSSDLIR